MVSEPVVYEREKPAYPFGKTSDKTFYNWLGYEIKISKREIEQLEQWVAKLEQLRAEIKAKHTRSK